MLEQAKIEQGSVYFEQSEYLDSEGYVDFMEFRLIYDGPLKATSRRNPRVQDKHAIRKQLHGQLVNQWAGHPHLKLMRDHAPGESDLIAEVGRSMGVWFADPGTSVVETFARRFTRSNGFRFVPLVSKELDLICGLDILFLRRENPGDLLSQGGDIDNRIKTLFDALKIPSDGGEMPLDARPEPSEDPFYCLLENDSLVTDLKVTTDRLLRPISEDEGRSNVVLVINVVVKASRITWRNLQLL